MIGIVLEIVWKSTVVMAAAFAATWLLRHGSAAVRHFVWTVAFAVMLALPLVVAMGPKWAPPETAPAKAQLPAVSGKPTAAVIAVTVRGSAVPDRRFPVEILYLVGALAVAGRFAIGIWRTRKLVRESSVAEHAVEVVSDLRDALGMRRPVRTLENSAAPVPMAWGVLRPVVLLPETARDWPAPRLRTVLLHELFHVKQNDLLAQMVAQAACCLYWFHPLVWMAARELRKEREGACDDAVLSRGVAPAEYAGHLMDLVRSMAAHRSSLADAPAMAGSGDLELRVRALLDRGRNRTPLSRRVALAVTTLVCALVLPVATLTTHAQAGKGAIAGIVTDPSGARVPGCSVTLRNLDGGNQEVTKVNMAGEYGFAAIPAGKYVVEVRAPGFKMSQKEWVVTAGGGTRADVALELGSMSETVTVRGSRGPSAPAPARPSGPAGTAVRIPIGGNVQAAKLIRQPKPDYPDYLKQQGITGTVMLRMIVSKTGEPLNPEVVNTDVHPALAQAALDAVKQWRYSPTLLNGQPVEVMTTVSIAFELEQ
jgi:TonB family protein